MVQYYICGFMILKNYWQTLIIVDTYTEKSLHIIPLLIMYKIIFYFN